MRNYNRYSPCIFCFFYLAVIFFIACFSPSGSHVFMLLLPALYYVQRRLIFALIPCKRIWVPPAVLVAILVILFLPITKQEIASCYIEQASMVSARSHSAEAVHALLCATQWAPDHPDLLYQKYLTAKDRGVPDQAEDYLLRSIEGGCDNADALYQAARVYANRGIREKEVSLYLRVLEKDPKYPEANYCLAMYYAMDHDRENAVNYLRAARDNLPVGNIWRQRCESILRSYGVDR
jgi:tetratricopeptide (TPR) repeat protein